MYPSAGPATLAGVKSHLRIVDDVDDDLITAVVEAVNAKIRTWPVAGPADQDEAPADWSDWPHITQGATLLAARLFRRRNSPDGVTAFNDAGPAYIARIDPDVALLLQIGTNVAPKVG